MKKQNKACKCGHWDTAHRHKLFECDVCGDGKKHRSGRPVCVYCGCTSFTSDEFATHVKRAQVIARRKCYGVNV